MVPMDVRKLYRTFETIQMSLRRIENMLTSNQAFSVAPSHHGTGDGITQDLLEEPIRTNEDFTKFCENLEAPSYMEAILINGSLLKF